MNKPNTKRWIVSFFALVLTGLLILSGIAYAIDPFFQFRVKDNAYMLSGWFVGSGLIENYDYDTLIIGSSMTYNFDMDVFRDELDVKPLHVGLGGIQLSEFYRLMDTAYDTNKCENYYICVDLSSFSSKDSGSRYPEYLLKKDILSRFRYLLNYEVWFRYIPVDVSLMLIDQTGISLPEQYAYKRNIDKLGDTRLEDQYSKDIVLRNFTKGKASVSKVDLENLYERMISHIDEYLDRIDFTKGKYTFFFPPYSSLYWCNAYKSGYLETYLLAKQYFIERVSEHDVLIYDFQHADCTTNLDNYKDTTHYHPKVNDWMVKCFASGDYMATKQNISSFKEKLTQTTFSFFNEYKYLFD